MTKIKKNSTESSKRKGKKRPVDGFGGCSRRLYQKVYDHVSQPDPPSDSSSSVTGVLSSHNVAIHNGLLKADGKYVLLRGESEWVLKEVHEEMGHLSVRDMTQTVRRHFTYMQQRYGSLSKDLKLVVKSCSQCNGIGSSAATIGFDAYEGAHIVLISNPAGSPRRIVVNLQMAVQDTEKVSPDLRKSSQNRVNSTPVAKKRARQPPVRFQAEVPMKRQKKLQARTPAKDTTRTARQAAKVNVVVQNGPLADDAADAEKAEDAEDEEDDVVVIHEVPAPPKRTFVIPKLSMRNNAVNQGVISPMIQKPTGILENHTNDRASANSDGQKQVEPYVIDLTSENDRDVSNRGLQEQQMDDGHNRDFVLRDVKTQSGPQLDDGNNGDVDYRDLLQQTAQRVTQLAKENHRDIPKEQLNDGNSRGSEYRDVLKQARLAIDNDREFSNRDLHKQQLDNGHNRGSDYRDVLKQARLAIDSDREFLHRDVCLPQKIKDSSFTVGRDHTEQKIASWVPLSAGSRPVLSYEALIAMQLAAIRREKRDTDYHDYRMKTAADEVRDSRKSDVQIHQPAPLPSDDDRDVSLFNVTCDSVQGEGDVGNPLIKDTDIEILKNRSCDVSNRDSQNRDVHNEEEQQLVQFTTENRESLEDVLVLPPLIPLSNIKREVCGEDNLGDRQQSRHSDDTTDPDCDTPYRDVEIIDTLAHFAADFCGATEDSPVLAPLIPISSIKREVCGEAYPGEGQPEEQLDTNIDRDIQDSDVHITDADNRDESADENFLVLPTLISLSSIKREVGEAATGPEENVESCQGGLKPRSVKTEVVDPPQMNIKPEPGIYEGEVMVIGSPSQSAQIAEENEEFVANRNVLVVRTDYGIFSVPAGYKPRKPKTYIVKNKVMKDGTVQCTISIFLTKLELFEQAEGERIDWFEELWVDSSVPKGKRVIDTDGYGVLFLPEDADASFGCVEEEESDLLTVVFTVTLRRTPEVRMEECIDL